MACKLSSTGSVEVRTVTNTGWLSVTLEDGKPRLFIGTSTGSKWIEMSISRTLTLICCLIKAHILGLWRKSI